MGRVVHLILNCGYGWDRAVGVLFINCLEQKIVALLI